MENPKDILLRREQAAESICRRMKLEFLLKTYKSTVHKTLVDLKSSTALTEVR